MSAPAALAIAKLIYPETKKTKADSKAIQNFPKRYHCVNLLLNDQIKLIILSGATHIFEVISVGATSMVKAVGAIVSNLISFVAIFSFLDATIAWFLSMLGLQNAGFSLVLKYLFYPFALVMGVDFGDCLSVAKLLGIKTFINEFVAYKELGDVIDFRNKILKNGTYEQYKSGILTIPNNIDMIWEVNKNDMLHRN